MHKMSLYWLNYIARCIQIGLFQYTTNAINDSKLTFAIRESHSKASNAFFYPARLNKCITKVLNIYEKI